MVDDIDSTRNRVFSQAREKALESAAIIVSGMSLLVAILSLVIASVALFVSIEAMQAAGEEAAETRIELNARYDQLVIKHDTTQVYVRDLKAYLIKQGFEPPAEER